MLNICILEREVAFYVFQFLLPGMLPGDPTMYFSVYLLKYLSFFILESAGQTVLLSYGHFLDVLGAKLCEMKQNIPAHIGEIKEPISFKVTHLLNYA